MKQAKLSPWGNTSLQFTTWNQRDNSHEENRVNKFCISLEPNTNTTHRFCNSRNKFLLAQSVSWAADPCCACHCHQPCNGHRALLLPLRCAGSELLALLQFYFLKSKSPAACYSQNGLDKMAAGPIPSSLQRQQLTISVLNTTTRSQSGIP